MKTTSSVPKSHVPTHAPGAQSTRGTRLPLQSPAPAQRSASPAGAVPTPVQGRPEQPGDARVALMRYYVAQATVFFCSAWAELTVHWQAFSEAVISWWRGDDSWAAFVPPVVPAAKASVEDATPPRGRSRKVRSQPLKLPVVCPPRPAQVDQGTMTDAIGWQVFGPERNLDAKLIEAQASLAAVAFEARRNKSQALAAAVKLHRNIDALHQERAVLQTQLGDSAQRINDLDVMTQQQAQELQESHEAYRELARRYRAATATNEKNLGQLRDKMAALTATHGSGQDDADTPRASRQPKVIWASPPRPLMQASQRLNAITSDAQDDGGHIGQVQELSQELRDAQAQAKVLRQQLRLSRDEALAKEDESNRLSEDVAFLQSELEGANRRAKPSPPVSETVEFSSEASSELPDLPFSRPVAPSRTHRRPVR